MEVNKLVQKYKEARAEIQRMVELEKTLKDDEKVLAAKASLDENDELAPIRTIRAKLSLLPVKQMQFAALVKSLEHDLQEAILALYQGMERLRKQKAEAYRQEWRQQIAAQGGGQSAVEKILSELPRYQKLTAPWFAHPPTHLVGDELVDQFAQMDALWADFERTTAEKAEATPAK